MNRRLWFFLGILAGGAVALLYAPQPGRRTRTMLSSKSKQGQRFLREQSESVRDNVSEAFGRGRVAVSKSMRGFMG